jgi:hypothetical protein
MLRRAAQQVDAQAPGGAEPATVEGPGLHRGDRGRVGQQRVEGEGVDVARCGVLKVAAAVVDEVAAAITAEPGLVVAASVWGLAAGPACATSTTSPGSSARYRGLSENRNRSRSIQAVRSWIQATLAAASGARLSGTSSETTLRVPVVACVRLARWVLLS